MRTEVGQPRFTEILDNVGDGDLVRMLGAELREVVNAVTTTGKAGKLSLVVSVSMDGKKMIRLQCESKTSVPREPIEGAMFFVGDRGGLHRENPRQPQLPGVSIVKGDMS